MTNICDMGEQYEADYYASVVDDLRVANERLHETINDLRNKNAHGERSTELIREYLRCLEDGNTIEPITFQMHQHIA